MDNTSSTNFDLSLQEEELPCTILQCVQDAKYVQEFDDVSTGEGREIKKTTPKSPHLQAFVERVIQTLKHAVQIGFCVISERYLDYLRKVGADWYNNVRGHTGRGDLPPIRESDTPLAVDMTKQRMICVEELGGHVEPTAVLHDR